jgi:hypothetical protein
MIAFRCIALAAFCAAAAATPAAATLAEDIARQVEAQSRLTIEAVETLRQAMVAVSQRGQFTFRRAVSVDEPPQGYGIYTERSNNVFKIGEELLVYIEPVGLTWSDRGGYFRSLALIDYEVRTPEGRVLLGQRDAGTVELRSREQNQEVMYQFSLNLSGGSPGRFLLAVTYRDAESGEAATFELPFELQ